jgi:hypothetical protein
MDKTKTLLGAVAGLATMGAAHATIAPAPNPSEFLQASSYSDLLAPVQNAPALLKADNTMRASEGVQQDDVGRIPPGNVQEADYYGPPPGYRHHHHHHHQAYRRDHHHHHTSYVGVPGVGGVVVR